MLFKAISILGLSSLVSLAQPFTFRDLAWGKSIASTTSNTNIALYLWDASNTNGMTSTNSGVAMTNGAPLYTWTNQTGILTGTGSPSTPAVLEVFPNSAAYSPILKKNQGTNGQGWTLDFIPSAGAAVEVLTIPHQIQKTYTQPFTVLLVGNAQGGTGADSFLDTGEEFNFFHTSLGWAAGAGNTIYIDNGTVLSGPAAYPGMATNAVLLSAVYKGSNSYLRTNGTQYVYGNAGNLGLTMHGMGGDASFALHGQISYCKIWNYELDTNTLQTEELYCRTNFFLY